MTFNVKNEVDAAVARIEPVVQKTPLLNSRPLSEQTGCQVFLKCENLQLTGSFKIRGAMNKLLDLFSRHQGEQIVTASTGNHGAAVAWSLNKLNLKGVIFVPENTAETKINNIRRYHIPVEYHATSCEETESYAIEYAREHEMIYVSAYDDPFIIGGQGTIAVEILKTLPDLDALFVPVSGGGLIAGIAGYIKALNPRIKIIGCQPENSPVMMESVKAGKILAMQTQPTLADALAGGVDPATMTFELCKKFVDEYISVTEEDIAAAMAMVYRTHHLVIEGAAGVAVAAFLNTAEKYAGKNIVILLSGGNVHLQILNEILNKHCK